MVPSKPRRSAPKSAPGKAAPRRRPKPVIEADAGMDAEARSRRISLRTGIFLLVIAAVLLAFLSPLNAALKQAQQIAALNEEIETTKAEVKSLEEKNENLRDPDYIKRKAREDQYYVEKGKNAVIVTNQEAVDDETESARPVRKQAWYLELLESIQETGNTVEKS
ncbi:septum formation initiator family protein [Brevibacterium linens]|uniref:Cell division protein FtsB n=2 Tax=Brevibacterium linens TaxID=1703 RepID=A0A2H1JC74_BRELN|nr:septum formation initiator family protein [Brevibacterium linens]KAB1947006.1 septum formation initiator family protein [Brevibacterium linens ATCC 9172]SMX84944.1 Cell division protein FtsB [Brevibacterium linens]SMX91467.1 Cell division protein FtsB [Brevibacterium linens ATCC 9172]